ncbi:MAG TPA: efflux RND transporter periplasmic adaptor subunit [Candidatus Paceibacterota bacterium]|nr:efflux RND transporter periplasmic adaptor subunit [Candidatus Paceibacterota bacterium]
MINDILYRVWAFLRGLWKRIHLFFSKLGVWKSVALIAGVIIVLLVAKHFIFGGAPAAEVTTNDTPTVTVKSVAALMEGGSPLSIAGQVQSQTQATVNSEKSGTITSVNYALGDYVYAGAVIAQIENASERAAVAQAQAAVDAATAGSQTSQTTLAAAQGNAVTALLSAYGTTDSSIKGTVDPMFSNPTSNQPQLNVTSSDSQAKVDSENGRLKINTVLNREHARSASLSSSDDLMAEITTTQAELRQTRDFFDTLIRALNAGIATQTVSDSTLTAYKASAAAARASITGSISTLIGIQQALQTAQQNSSQTTGVSATQAGLAQAQAGLAAARANLEKSIIRAPISGTINSLPLKVGNFIASFSPAVTIANNGALEVIAYVTQNDTAQISVGGKAVIEGSVAGVITRIAPALDPLTKKIEVRVGITGKNTLINGQSVSVELGSAPKPTTALTKITIPLAALKIAADGMSVFTVNASNTLETQPVTIGELMGDRVVIISGLTATTTIVTDARGLRAGQSVNVR